MQDYKNCVFYQRGECGMANKFADKPNVRLVCDKCVDYEEAEPIVAQLFHEENFRDAETVPVVTEKAKAVHDYRKCANRCRDCNILSCDECTNFVPKRDAVNHPEHYTQGGIECIEALKAATTGLQGIEAVCTANAIKYIWRWKHKNGIQDIDKAIWYLKRLKKELESNENK